MEKPHTTPMPPATRLGTAVLAEDLNDGIRRQRSQELTWMPRSPAHVPPDEEHRDHESS